MDGGAVIGAGRTETIIAFFFITASAGIRDATTYEQMRKRIICMN